MPVLLPELSAGFVPALEPVFGICRPRMNRHHHFSRIRLPPQEQMTHRLAGVRTQYTAAKAKKIFEKKWSLLDECCHFARRAKDQQLNKLRKPFERMGRNGAALQNAANSFAHTFCCRPLAVRR